VTEEAGAHAAEGGAPALVEVHGAELAQALAVAVEDCAPAPAERRVDVGEQGIAAEQRERAREVDPISRRR
jgi:hypothetical protein